MKIVEKLAVVVIVLWFVTKMPIVTNALAARLWGPEQFGKLTLSFRAMMVLNTFLAAAVQIGVAVWLHILAKKEKANAIIWTMFGLVFGLFAVALFFIVRIYDRFQTGTVPVKGSQKTS